jgi:hypothetical protein
MSVLSKFPAITVAAVLLASCVGPSALAAQSRDEVQAYLVLLETPTGGLAPVLSDAMLGITTKTPTLALRHGHVSVSSTTPVGNSIIDNTALTLSVPVGRRAQVGVTGEYEKLRCDTATPDSSGMTREPFPCGNHRVVGAFAEARLSSTPIGAGQNAPQLTFGLRGEAGYARAPFAVTHKSATAGVPVALVVGGPTMRIAPFLTPAIGWGHFALQGGSSDGVLPMLGGGVTLQSTASWLSANVGFQKVFISRGNTVFGVSFSVGR